MCNAICVATSSKADLARFDREEPSLRFEEPLSDFETTLFQDLAPPHRWIITRFGGCSCHFRAVFKGCSLDFHPPEDWHPEDDGDVAATRLVYDVIRRMVEEGEEVEVACHWTSDAPTFVKQIVKLSEVSREAFRFWDGYRFLVGP